MGTSVSKINSNKVTFIAISSDYRELYKADIYKVLAKPFNAIEHFRYKKNWISNTLDCVESSKLIGQEVIIVFKHVSKDSDELTKYIPIRKAVIVGFEKNDDTDVYHYYFQLKEFCKIEDQIEFDNSILFSQRINTKSSNSNWKDKIEEIKDYFKEVIFYNFQDIINEKNEKLEIKFDKFNFSYFYEFNQGKSYTINLLISNINNSQNTLSIKSSSTDVDVILTENYYVSVPFDKLRIPITTKSLDNFSERSFISLYLKNSEENLIKEYENHIHIIKKMNIIKPIWFGVLSAVLIGCSWLLKDKTKSIENIFNSDLQFDYMALIYVLLIILSSSFLYSIFNKK